MIDYYDKFIENRATKFQPLYGCLNKNQFRWTEACQIAFKKAKEDLKPKGFEL